MERTHRGCRRDRLLSLAALIFIITALVVLPGRAQSVSVFDTVYTPVGDIGGTWLGTMFVPAHSNGSGVVVIHGGGVSRATNRPWCDALAAEGYVVLTIDYLDNTVYPTGARAVKLAIEFLRRGAGQFTIRTGQIVGLGFSDGATFIGEILPWANDDATFHTDSQIDDHLDAAILLYGEYSQDNIPPGARSCMRNVTQVSTPLLLMHGTNDMSVPWTQSQEFYDSLHAHNKDCQLRLFDGGGHGFELNWPATTSFTAAGLIARDTAIAFLKRELTHSIAVFEPAESRPRDFLLEQNYPNPFNPTTAVSFQLSALSKTRIAIYDLLGREIKVLVDEFKPAGIYEVSWDAAGYATGTYICRMLAGDFVAARKLVLMK